MVSQHNTKKIVTEKGNEKCVCVLKAKLYLSANLYYNTRRESKKKKLIHACTYLFNVTPRAWTFEHTLS